MTHRNAEPLRAMPSDAGVMQKWEQLGRKGSRPTLLKHRRQTGSSSGVTIGKHAKNCAGLTVEVGVERRFADHAARIDTKNYQQGIK